MKSIFSVFQRGLQKTATSLTRSIAGVFTGHEPWTAETYEKLNRSLIAADFGAATSNRISPRRGAPRSIAITETFS